MKEKDKFAKLVIKIDVKGKLLFYQDITYGLIKLFFIIRFEIP